MTVRERFTPEKPTNTAAALTPAVVAGAFAWLTTWILGDDVTSVAEIPAEGVVPITITWTLVIQRFPRLFFGDRRA